MKLKFENVPLWVSIIFLTMEKLDYHLLSPVSMWLTLTRHNLLDRYCQCEKCLRRDSENPGWAGRPIK